MPRVIEITVTGDGSQYIAEINKITQRNRELNKDAIEGGARTAAAFNQSAAALGGVGASAEGSLIRMRQFASAVHISAEAVGEIGPAGGLAAHGIAEMLLASGPAGIALAALAGTVGFLAFRLNQARERLRELDEVFLAETGREKKALESENEIKRRIAV